MAVVSKLLGKNRDMPFVATVALPAVAAPNTNNYEVPCFTVPNLAALTPAASGSLGDLPVNSCAVRAIYLMPASTITGQGTNFFSFFVNPRRNLGISTTSVVTIASGSSTVTPSGGTGMNNIQVGTNLDIGAVGTPETVTVTAVTATTFTATFANTHTFVATAITIVNSATIPFMALPVSTTAAAAVNISGVTNPLWAVDPLSISNIAAGQSLAIAAGGGTAENVTVQAVSPFPVNTYSGTVVTSGSTTITPGSMNGIYQGSLVHFAAGGGTAEDVRVTAVTATTFTASFSFAHAVNTAITASTTSQFLANYTSAHTSSFAISTAPLASITYSAATVISQANNAVLFNPTPINNVLLPGDVVTVQRFANNGTGLATPLTSWEFELVPARVPGR